MHHHHLHCPYSFNPIKPLSPKIPSSFAISAIAPLRRPLPQNLQPPRLPKPPPRPVHRKRPTEPRQEEKQEKEPTPLQKAIESFKDETHIVENSGSEWTPEELDAIQSLFERKMPQKISITNQPKPRPLPLPLPYKTRLESFPTPKHHIRLAARTTLAYRSPVSDQVRKDPEFLMAIAKEIAALPLDSDVSKVLNRWSTFIQKGSLSMTIRQLGHLGLPNRALQTFLWVQKRHPDLYPDNRTLASTVEVLARRHRLKTEAEFENFLHSASKPVLEAITRGFIKGGDLYRARKLLKFGRRYKRRIHSSVIIKFIIEVAKNPDNNKLCNKLLDGLAWRKKLSFPPTDCTALMKVCIRLRRFVAIESLFKWYKETGKEVTVVMYTTVIHSRYCAKKYREGMALVWEMEAANMLLDLPAYRVVIRLCVALNDVERAARYFARTKVAGFAPGYDMYRDMVRVYGRSGRLAKCRQVCKEIEMAGFRLDEETVALLANVKRGVF